MEAYASIEDMAPNYYQWASEPAITAPYPQIEESGEYEISAFDALFQNFENFNEGVVSQTFTTPPCEKCGIVGHIWAECQFEASSAEQDNYAHWENPFSNTYNPEWENHSNFSYENNFLDSASRAPPSFQSQEVFNDSQKSNLEVLLESFVSSQIKQNEEFRNQSVYLNDMLIQLTSKIDSITTHTEMLETQISQVAQQVASSSRSSGTFPRQPEQNLNDHCNVVTLRSDKQLEESKGTNKDSVSENERETQNKSEVSEKKSPPPPPHLQRLFKVDQSNDIVVVEDDSKEIYHEMENTKAAEISPLNRYIKTCVDVVVLYPLSYFSPSSMKITFDQGRIENKILLLTQPPFYKSWDPGLCFHSLCVTWSLCVRQWDPGINL